MEYIDQAQKTEANFRRREISKALGASRVNHPSLERCLDCEKSIPLKRRQLVPGCSRCVQCQTEHEENER